MNFFNRLFLNLCTAANPSPPLVTTSDASEDNPVLCILLIIAITAVLIILPIIFIKIGNHKDKKIDAENKAEQTEQTQSIELKENCDANEHMQGNPQQPQPSTTQQAPATQTEPKSGHGFLKFIVKLILLGGIVFFALWNYRLFEINKGWSKTEINNKSSFSQVIGLITDIEEVEYFKIPHSCDSDNYKIHITTTTDSYLFDTDEDGIKALKLLALPSNVKPESVTVIPFYVEIVVGLLVIIIPFGKRK